MAEALKAGKKLRDRTVAITDGSKKKLSALSGPKGLILYFYPRDNTPGCTKEACSFRDNHTRLKKMGYGLVGVSTDSVRSHQSFTEKQNLNFPLIADEEHALAEACGVYGEKKLYGKSYMGITRTTFVLDPDLRVRRVYDKVKVDGHSEQILGDLKSDGD